MLRDDGASLQSNGTTEPNAKKWYDAARKWYEQAESAHDEDLWIKQRLTEFLSGSNQIGEAERYLDAIIQGGGGKSAKTATWARRGEPRFMPAEPMALCIWTKQWPSSSRTVSLPQRAKRARPLLIRMICGFLPEYSI